jgi:hypothetical protein
MYHSKSNPKNYSLLGHDVGYFSISVSGEADAFIFPHLFYPEDEGSRKRWYLYIELGTAVMLLSHI